MFSQKWFAQCVAVVLTFALTACGGGGSSTSGSTSGSTTPAVTTYTVSTSAGEGTSFAPATVSVESGKTASLTVTLKPGYSNAVFEGCGSKITLASPDSTPFVTGPVTGNCTITGTATKAQSTYKVAFSSTGGSVMNLAGTQVLSGQTVEVKAGDSLEVFSAPNRGYQRTGDDFVTTCQKSATGVSTMRITPVSDCTVNFTPKLLDDNHNFIADRDETNFIVHSVDVSPKAIRVADIGKTNVVFTLYATGSQGKRSDGSLAAVSKIVVRTRLQGVGVPAEDLFSDVTLSYDSAKSDTKSGMNAYTAQVTPTGVSDRFGTNYSGQMRLVSNDLTLLSSSGEQLSSFDIDMLSKSTVMMTIKDSVAPAGNFTKVADNVYRSQNFINIVDPTYSRRDDEQWLTRTAAKYVSGAFDVVAKYNYGESFGLNWAYFGRVKQFASGIGFKDAYDNSADYGLPGICGIITFGTSFVAGYPFNHELGHCWSAYLRDDKLRLATDGGHWGVTTEGLAVMSQNGLSIAGGPGNWKAVFPSDFDTFAMLDLHLGGMADISEVPSMYYVNDINYSTNLTPGTSVPDAKVSYMTSADLVRVYGARTPSYDGKVKNLRVLSIVVSPKPLTEAERAAMEIILANQAGKGKANVDNGDVTPAGFSVACRNRCTLSVDIGTPTAASAQAQAMRLPTQTTVRPAPRPDIVIYRERPTRGIQP